MTKKIAFITGASSGLGQETVIRFAEGGYQVFASVRNLKDLDELIAKYPTVKAVPLDLTKSEQIDQAFQMISNECSKEGLATLVNVAGYSIFSPIEYTDEQEVRSMFEVLFFAPFKLTQVFLPLLKQYYQKNQVRPKIINVISWAAVSPGPWNAFYYAAKAALLSFSESQFYELDKVNVDTVAIVPGLMETPFVTRKSEWELQRGIARLPEEGKRTYGKYLERLVAMAIKAKKSSILSDPKLVAEKIFKTAERQRPSFRYNLGLDTKLTNFFTRFLPFCLNSYMKRTIFKLNGN